MCGIFVAHLRSLKKESAAQIVLAGLKRLEYRGYDSWGVAVAAADQLSLDKHAGQIGDVKNELPLPKTAIALGHTRWATHGGVSDINAHPHSASDGSFVLVQNGVLENYQELGVDLKNKGYTFISQTDTEVIVRLIESKKKIGELPSLESVLVAFRECAGRNTVGILASDGSVIAVRYGSPLIIGKNEHEDVFLSSDVLSLAAVASDFYSVQNNQVVVISPAGSLQVYAVETGLPVPFHFAPIAVSQLQVTKDEHQFFMRKEIYEQAVVLSKPLVQKRELWSSLAQKLKNARSIYTVGSGSADFVSQQLAFLLRQIGLGAQAIKAYEARSFRSLFGPQDLGIAVSQSGETADTIEVLEWMKSAGMTIASIVNMPGSTITTMSDLPFMLQIGPEVGIASTKAVTSAVVWSMAVAEFYQKNELTTFQQSLKKYQELLPDWLAETEASSVFVELLDSLKTAHSVFVLGRGQLYAAGLEFALKMKEISYIHTESFSGGELKHGVIALIEKNTPVICLIAEDQEKPDMLSAAAQVKARGAKVIGVSREDNDVFDIWIPMLADPSLAMISSVLPAQLLTYHLALAKGLNPDKPRNLAKSVTVK